MTAQRLSALGFGRLMAAEFLVDETVLLPAGVAL
jgi:hypothetical protein